MHNKNFLIFAFETTFYILCLISFLIMYFFFDINEEKAHIIYITFISISFVWLYSNDFLLKKYDNAVHFKMFKKHYIPAKSDNNTYDYKRKGLYGVILLWIAFLGFICFLKLSGILTWEIFLAGASFMFILNSVFSRKVCLLSKLFLHNKNNCCKYCGINCWDYAIFASPLVFAPTLSLIATVINYLIIAISFAVLIMWEYNYKKYPYRFYPETNLNLSCKHCIKKCNHRQPSSPKQHNDVKVK